MPIRGSRDEFGRDRRDAERNGRDRRDTEAKERNRRDSEERDTGANKVSFSLSRMFSLPPYLSLVSLLSPSSLSLHLSCSLPCLVLSVVFVLDM